MSESYEAWAARKAGWTEAEKEADQARHRAWMDAMMNRTEAEKQADLARHNAAYEAGWKENCRRLDLHLLANGYAEWIPDDSPYANDPRVIAAKKAIRKAQKKREKKLGKKSRYTPSPLSPALKFLIMKRDGYRCRLCGIAARDGEHVRLEVDHITARANHGTDDPSNLWVLCFDCNRGKGTQDL